ncbi:MAG: hypothetical protein DRI24_24420 [Deltaproteobacteria bacterium]|nr:MAG: hypothetical protein DRI24_24420 [Deltaproteobacteria bacterium]
MIKYSRVKAANGWRILTVDTVLMTKNLGSIMEYQEACRLLRYLKAKQEIVEYENNVLNLQ